MNSEVRQAIAGVLIAAGAVVLGVGLFLGFGGISKGGESCGSAFQPSETFMMSDDCTDATTNRKPVALGLSLPGGALFLVGLITYLAEGQARREQAAEASSTDTADNTPA